MKALVYFCLLIGAVAASVGLTYLLSDQGILPIAEQGPAGPRGEQGLQGPPGPKGDKGDPGSFAGDTFSDHGPYVLDIGTGTGALSIEDVQPGDLVIFIFHVSGSDVFYWVEDMFGNAILIGNYEMGPQKTPSGGGSFIVSFSQPYRLAFSSTGIFTPSVITIEYDIQTTS